MKLDTSFVRAKPLLIPAATHVDLILCGAGGTGSWLAPHVVRSARALIEQGRDVSVRFVDPDVVEVKNLGRQNFCDAEVGMDKAATLAMRFGMAWHVPVEAIVEPFCEGHLPAGMDRVAILIGAVDNADARVTMNAVLRRNRKGFPPSIYYLDLGNSKESGQCLLGTSVTEEDVRDAFRTPGICSALPSPLLQDTSLAIARPEEQEDQTALSCAELTALNLQSPAINAMMAAIGAEYLWALLVTGGLRRFATYVNLRPGTMSSNWTTPEHLARAIQRPVTFLHRRRARAS